MPSPSSSSSKSSNSACFSPRSGASIAGAGSRVTIDVRRKAYPAVGAAAGKQALADVRIEAGGGEFVAIVGPSGCGKTTLLNIVAGLDDDFEGRVHVDRGAQERPERSSETHRDRSDVIGAVIGYVFQTPRLLPWRTVEENLRLVLADGADAADRVDAILRAVDLEDARAVYPNRLSVGMARRVAIARAFVVEPDLLLMDEPFVSIDTPTADRLRRLLLDILAVRPTTVLFVTHDLREAIFLADRIVFLSASPARVMADVPVAIARGARSEARIEALRDDLVRQRRASAGQEPPSSRTIL